MKTNKLFLIKTINILLILLFLCAYQLIVVQRQYQQENAELSEKVKAYQEFEKERMTSEIVQYKDGTYEGTGQGFGGQIKVDVEVKEGKMKEIKILEAKGEDYSYLKMGQEIISSIITVQSTDVDTISGATFSSNGIRDAVKNAMEQAVNNENKK